MKILILNWRDIHNPSSGGAEILTHEIAKRLVKKGNSITLFSSQFEGCLAEENIDGVHIIRRGYADARLLFSSVHFQAFVTYRKELKGKYDVVIDQIHGLPFFTPWYVREKKIVLICEVAGDLWYTMFGNFFGVFGRTIEKIYLKYIYNGVPYLTISQSTREELTQNGVQSQITVIPMGITVPSSIPTAEKEKELTVLFVGRLSPAKGIEDALCAIAKVKNDFNNIQFWVVGRGGGDYTKYLKKLCKTLQIEPNVVFYGFVNEKEKFLLMKRATVLVCPSQKEGFGLIVPEAGYVGTPAIVYNVPGLSEVVEHKKNGLICKVNTPDELAENILQLASDTTLLEKLSVCAREKSKQYTWDKSADIVLQVLKKL